MADSVDYIGGGQMDRWVGQPIWPKNVLRQRPFSESRSGRNGRNVKREKRQELLRK